MAGYYAATQQHNAAAPLADFCTAAYTLIFGSRRYRIAYDLLIQDVIREIEQFQLGA